MVKVIYRLLNKATKTGAKRTRETGSCILFMLRLPSAICIWKKGDKELDQQQFDFDIIKYVMYNRRLCLAWKNINKRYWLYYALCAYNMLWLWIYINAYVVSISGLAGSQICRRIVLIVNAGHPIVTSHTAKPADREGTLSHASSHQMQGKLR